MASVQTIAQPVAAPPPVATMAAAAALGQRFIGIE
jgi:hypothetical protein